MNTHLWLDDIRAAPEGWTWVKTAAEAIDMLKTGLVQYASLDHDLAEEHYAGGGYCDTGYEAAATGYDVCKWMVDNNVYPTTFLKFHTANPVGRINMTQLIQRYNPGVLEWRK